VDVLVVMPMQVQAGAVVKCRPIGLLRMADESGDDAKVIAVPVEEVTSIYRDVQSVDDVDSLLLGQIRHFFEHYKDLETNKWVKVDGWEDVDSARKEIMDSIRRFNESPDQPNF